MKQQLQFALVAVLVQSFLPSAASDDGLLDAEGLQEMVDTFRDNLAHGNAAQLMGEGQTDDGERRLQAKKKGEGAVPDINYAAVCGGACWQKLSNSFRTALTTLDGSVCKKKKQVEKVDKVKAATQANKERKSADAAGKGKDKGVGAGAAGGKGGKDTTAKPAGEGGRRLRNAGAPKTKPTKQEAACIFDICAEPQVTAMCANMTNIADNYEVDACQKANAVFLCSSVCNSTCTTDVPMKKLLCGKTGDSKGGKFDSDKGGGGLKQMFGMMCMKNGNKYCYDLIKNQSKAKKYNQGKDDKKFPNPCDLNCTSPMATSIKALGCCFPAFMSIQRKHDIMKRGQARNAKAVAVKCAGTTAFNTCATGNLTRIKNKQFKIDLSAACDILANETTEDTLVTTMTEMLNLTEGALEMLQCQKKGAICAGGTTGGRLLQEATGSETTINVETSGDDADAQLAAISASLSDPAFLADLAATSEESAGMDVTTPAPGTTAGGLVAGAQGGHALGFVSLILAVVAACL